jgi:glycerol-3-phosphate acyltransferase PlsY
MDAARWPAALLSAYLLGSIPTAYLLVRWLKRIDIRTVGSGSVGATNVTRIAGWWAGLGVFLLDAAKGAVAVRGLAEGMFGLPVPAGRLACGVLAIVGHVLPVFLRFQGGKGVATTIGVLLAADPVVAGGMLAVWAVVFAACRYVSIGSLAAAASVPVLQTVLGRTALERAFGLALFAAIVVTHRANLARLRQGREHRAGKRVDEPDRTP